MLLLYLVFKGVVLHFHASAVPFLFVLSNKHFSKTRIQLFLYLFLLFFFSCGKLDCKLFVYWKTSFFCSFVTCSCIGDKGGEWAVIAVRVSSFQFLNTKDANEGTEGVVRRRVFSSSFSLSSFFCFSLKNESPDGCKAKNHKYWVPSFGEFNVLSSVKS